MMAVPLEPLLADCQMSIKTILLEKEYERVVADSTRLLDAERDRARRIDCLLLKFESETLRAQLEQANTRVQGTARAEGEALLQLDYACKEINRLERVTTASAHEIANLKAEISSFNGSSTHHKKLMSENVQLSRDLSALTSEIERFKAQSASQLAAGAGKLEMERQLNSLEVELENEKHSHERTRAKTVSQAADINTLATRVEELQSEIARESRAKQQRENDDGQMHIEWENQRTALENRVETLKKQLRSAKDKLQEAQHDLQQRRSFAKAAEDDASEPRTRKVPLQRAGSSNDYQDGVTIATPGAVRMQEKPSRQSALPGDKSVFSITPFLNRTGAPRDSPISSEVDEEEMREAMSKPSKSLGKNSSFPAAGETDISPEPVLKQKTTVIASNPTAKMREGKSLGAPARKALGTTDVKIPLKDAGDESLIDQGQGRLPPKKRKLGAQRGDRALLDDEDEGVFETKPKGRKLGLGAGRASVLTTSQAPGVSGVGEKLPRTLGFGSFSPLKRDRKR